MITAYHLIFVIMSSSKVSKQKEYQHTVLVCEVDNYILLSVFQKTLSWTELSFHLLFAETDGHSYLSGRPECGFL